MPKVIVEVGIPSIGQTVDFSLPDKMRAEVLLLLICEALKNHLKIEFPYHSLHLAIRTEGQVCEILSPHTTLAESGIRDGDMIFLI